MTVKQENKLKIMAALFVLTIHCGAACLASDIVFQGVPDAGIQPVLTTDEEGGIHLLYFRESEDTPGQGYFYYRQRMENGWSDAIQVSTHPYPRPHLIARAALAVDDSGRIHVTWHQDYPVEDLPTPNSMAYLPDFLYTRSGDGNGVFEKERSVLRKFITGAETGAALTAKGDMVSMIWHGSDPEAADLESEGSVYQIVSHDDGKTFGSETLIGDKSLGACGCCGLAAAYDGRGNLQVAYRTAVNNEGRHMQLLETGAKTTGTTTLIHPWQLNACPVSTTDLARDGNGVNHLVFETKGLVYQAVLDRNNPKPRGIRSPVTKLLQKHPAIAINAQGEKLIVWNEGNGISGGGSLRWQLYNPAGEPVPRSENEAREVPVHSAASTAALRDGTFLVMY